MRKISNKSTKMKLIEHKRGVEIEELLRQMYVDENKPTQTIANELQLSYITTVKWLKLAGIHSRKLQL